MSLLQMSLSAGLLVIAIVFIRTVALNKLPKMMFLILWGVALFRLTIPFFIPMQFSIYDIIGGISKKIFPDNTVLSSIGNLISAGGSVTGITDTAGIAGPMNEVAREQIFSIAPMTTIWLIGMFSAFAFFTAIYIRNQRELRFATLIRDNDFLNEWLSEHKLLRPLAIMQSDRIKTPIAVGIIKPRIILPKSMNMDDKQLLSYVLTHEYYHIKRCDALWKLLLVFAFCVHWFNPMVWVMFILVNRDLELTCDEMVIRHFGTEVRTAYAYSLIGMAEQQSKFTPLYNGFSKNAAKERIVSIMKIKKTSRVGVILACVLISVLTVGVLAVSATDSPSENTSLPPDFVGGFIFTKAAPYETVTWAWDEDKGEWVKLDDNVTVIANEEMMTDTAGHFISMAKINDKGSGTITIAASPEMECTKFKFEMLPETKNGGGLRIFSPHPNMAEISLFYPEEGVEAGSFTLYFSETDGVESGMFSISITEKPDMKHQHRFPSFIHSFFNDRMIEKQIENEIENQIENMIENNDSTQ